MDKVDVTAEQLRKLLRYNKKTGVFTNRVHRSKRVRKGAVVGYLNDKGYLVVRINKKLYRLNRLAWLYVYGVWPVSQIDHINHNKSDNRFRNLRDVSKSGNMHNRKGPTVRNKSGFLGVSPSGRPSQPWRAQLQVDGVNIYIGRFATPKLAHAAYLEAKQKLHII